jgi:phage-related protein
MFTIKTHDDAKSEILDLPAELRGRTIKLIEKLEQFGQMQMPHSKSLGGGLFELRALERNNIARTIYVYQKEQTIFILHAFVKKTQKTQKTPVGAMQIARIRLKEMIENE